MKELEIPLKEIPDWVLKEANQRRLAKEQKITDFFEVWRLKWKYLHQQARNGMNEDQKLAIETALNIVLEDIENFEQLTLNNFELVREEARINVNWPVRISLHPGWAKNVSSMLRKLELGKESFLKMRPSSRTRLNSFAIQVIDGVLRRIHHARSLKRLPWFWGKIKGGSLPAWYGTAARLPYPPKWNHRMKWWDAFVTVFQTNFPAYEEDKRFRRLVFSKDKVEKGEVGSRIYTSQQRDVILKSLKRTFFARVNFPKQ